MIIINRYAGNQWDLLQIYTKILVWNWPSGVSAKWSFHSKPKIPYLPLNTVFIYFVPFCFKYDLSSCGKLIQHSISCSPLEHSSELIEYLWNMFLSTAQYDAPIVTAICEGIDAAAYGDDILSRIYAGVVVFYGNSTCLC